MRPFLKSHLSMALRLYLLPIAAALGCLCSLPSLAQSEVDKSSENARLSAPIEWGTIRTRIFKDKPEISLALRTSWIPKSASKGLFRFIVIATVDQTSSLIPEICVHAPCADYQPYWSESNLLRRVHACSIYLDVHDSEGFRLAEIEVPFSYQVDDEHVLKSLTANASEPMSKDDYRRFIGTPKLSGSLSFNWICGSEEDSD